MIAGFDHSLTIGLLLDFDIGFPYLLTADQTMLQVIVSAHQLPQTVQVTRYLASGLPHRDALPLTQVRRTKITVCLQIPVHRQLHLRLMQLTMLRQIGIGIRPVLQLLLETRRLGQED